MAFDSAERVPKPEEVLESLERINRFCTLEAEGMTCGELALGLQGVSRAVSTIARAYGGVEPSSAEYLFGDALPELSQEWPGLSLTETVMRCYLTQGPWAGKLLVAHAAHGADGAQLGVHHAVRTTSRTYLPPAVTHDAIIPDDKVLDVLLMREPATWREGDEYYARDFRGNERVVARPFRFDPVSEQNDAAIYTRVLQSLAGELSRAVNEQHPMTFITVDTAEA